MGQLHLLYNVACTCRLLMQLQLPSTMTELTVTKLNFQQKPQYLSLETNFLSTIVYQTYSHQISDHKELAQIPLSQSQI
mgnify:CR=1 FL=1